MSIRTWRRDAAIGGAAIAALCTAVAPMTKAAAFAPPTAGPAASHIKTVTNTNDSGAGSLRAAIFKLNNHPEKFDTIEFDIDGKRAHIISPETALPPITASNVVIDGYSQDGSAQATDADPAILKIVISMPSTVPGPGLELDADDSVVKGLVINGSAEHGLVVTGNGNLVTGSYFGTKHEGEVGAGNIGDGILVNGDDNTIGGAQPADANLLSANGENGIHIQSGKRTLVFGNRIGTDAAGLKAMGNADAGVLDQGTSSNISSNVLSGNEQNGLVLAGGLGVAVSNQVGVGQDSGTTIPLPNEEDGIVVAGEQNLVGDGDAGNTVAANGENGIVVSGIGNFVSANFVGIDSVATLGLGNDDDGILVTGTANEIGGSDRTLGNVASNNGRDGIHVLMAGHASGSDAVDNNLVGTDPTGLNAMPNKRDGIHIEGSDNPVRDNLVQFNRRNGVEVFGDRNQILTNTIWYNVLRGVEILDGVDNPIAGNSIDTNGRLGIDLDPVGVTRNDPGDGDGGPNETMNFPVVDQAFEVGTNTVAAWRIVDGLRTEQFQLEFFASDTCDASGHGEAATPLGTLTIATDSVGFAAGSDNTLAPAAPGQVVTATATLLDGTVLQGTSELSNCAVIQ